MYTAENAREKTSNSPNVLDERLQKEVEDAVYRGFNRASVRVYIDDPFVHNIKEELEKRGFTVDHVPDICLKGDVDFSW